MSGATYFAATEDTRALKPRRVVKDSLTTQTGSSEKTTVKKSLTVCITAGVLSITKDSSAVHQVLV